MTAELQKLVLSRRAALGKNGKMLSLRAAAERSMGRVTYETLSAINRGVHSGKLQEKSVEGLAIALDVPISQVYEAAAASQPMAPWTMPEAVWRLPSPQRREVERIARGYLRSYEQGLADALKRS